MVNGIFILSQNSMWYTSILCDKKIKRQKFDHSGTLISWFFYLFLLCSVSLLVKYDFILRYEAWVNAIRASSFVESFPQISAKPIAFQRNLLGKLSQNRPFSLPIIFQRTWPRKFPRNFREIGRFFLEFLPENPAKLDFFSTTYQKPCIKTSWCARIVYYQHIQ